MKKLSQNHSDCDRIATKKQTDHLAILDPDGTDEFVG